MKISFSSIYESYRSRPSEKYTHCKLQLQQSSLKDIDRACQKFLTLVHTPDPRWSPRKSLICLHTIYTCSPLSVIHLPSFLQCLDWTLDTVCTHDPALISPCISFLYTVYSSIHHLEPTESQPLIDRLRSHNTVDHLLRHLRLPHTMKLVQLVWTPESPLDMHTLLCCLDSVPDAVSHVCLNGDKEDILFCIEVCKLIYKCPTHRVSAHLRHLVSIWCGVCQRMMNLDVRNHVYYTDKVSSCLTSVLERCMRSDLSPDIVSEVRPVWLRFLRFTMKRWVFENCQNKKPGRSSPNDRKVIRWLLEMGIHMKPYVEDTSVLNDITKFITYVLCQPVIPDRVCFEYEYMHQGDTEEIERRDGHLEVTSEVLQKHEDLFVILLETYIKYCPKSSRAIPGAQARKMAWCIMTWMEVLEDQVKQSVLISRVHILVRYFFHHPAAVEQFAMASSRTSSYLYSPFINQIKSVMLSLADPTKEAVVKASKNLAAFTQVTHTTFACEKLIDSGALELIDASYIPPHDECQELVHLYTQYTRFIYSLCHHAPFVRTSLVEDYQLRTLLRGILSESIHRRSKDWETRQTPHGPLLLTQQDNLWTSVISNCLSILLTFRFIPTMFETTDPVPICRHLLTILFPWRAYTPIDTVSSHCVSSFWQGRDALLKEAVDVFELISTQTSFKRYMVSEKHAMTDLSHLIIHTGKRHRKRKCVDHHHHAYSLKSGAINLLTSKEIEMLLVTGDVFTSFFKPFLVHPFDQSSEQAWFRMIMDELAIKRTSLTNLFLFFDRDRGLREQSAVCAAYTYFHSDPSSVWMTLMDTLYHMFLSDSVSDEQAQRKRRAAAQVIELMGLEREREWKEVREKVKVLATLDPFCPAESMERVWFTLDDGVSMSANRELLVSNSKMFEAMLSSHFTESGMDSIAIHEIPSEDWASLLKVLENGLLEDACWDQVIILLQLSDQYSIVRVESLCIHWILQKIENLEMADDKLGVMEGIGLLYCVFSNHLESEEIYLSNTWHLSNMVTLSLMTVIQYLTLLCNADDFILMLKENNAHKVFFTRMTYLLTHSIH